MVATSLSNDRGKSCMPEVFSENEICCLGMVKCYLTFARYCKQDKASVNDRSQIQEVKC
jgi:hypothetical protein